jgi:hypothetical protein
MGELMECLWKEAFPECGKPIRLTPPLSDNRITKVKRWQQSRCLLLVMVKPDLALTDFDFQVDDKPVSLTLWLRSAKIRLGFSTLKGSLRALRDQSFLENKGKRQ